MRIAQLSMHSCPLARPGERDTGGMNVYILDLAHQLEARGFCVDIFTRYHTARDPQVISIGPRTRLIHVRAGEPSEPKEELHNYVDEFSEGVESFREQEALTYSIAHSHYWLSGAAGMTLSRRWGTPHLTSFHTLAEVKNEAFPDNHESPERAATEARVTTYTDRIIAWTQGEADALTRLYGASPLRTVVLPAGVDLDLFYPRNRDQARQRLGLSPDENVLLFVGRLEPIKGPDIFLRAAGLLESKQGLRLLVVGGDQRPNEGTRLRALAAELGLADHVTFVGPVPHDELPWYYSAADLLVVPSYYESFSLVTAESLSCGTPVVASRVGGLVTLVKEGVGGRLVAPAQPRAFAAHISDLLADEPLRRTMAMAAPGTVAHLGWPAIADRIVTVYAAALQGVQDLTPCLD